MVTHLEKRSLGSDALAKGKDQYEGPDSRHHSFWDVECHLSGGKRTGGSEVVDSQTQTPGEELIRMTGTWEVWRHSLANGQASPRCSYPSLCDIICSAYPGNTLTATVKC